MARYTSPLAVSAFTLMLLASVSCRKQVPAADMVIRRARIYTMDKDHPWGEAVAVKDGRILWVGSEKEADRYIQPKTEVVDAMGRMLLPGFIDSHLHVRLGSDPDVLRFAGGMTLRNLDGIKKQIREFARSRPDLKWIEGEGWLYSPDGTLPKARDLEGLTGGRPAFLVAYDYHTVWMNKEALHELGITRGTDHVAFAERIETDPATQEPTGILTGFGSTGLSGEAEADLRRHIPSHSPERLYRRVKTNIELAVRYGITTVVDPQSFLEDLEIYSKLRDGGALPARLQVAMFFRRGAPDNLLEEYDTARRKFADDRLRVSAIKLYIDDVIEAHTAAMLQPYSDRTDLSGQTDWPPDEFNDIVAKIDRMKFQIFIHSIGDRGIRTSLDALEHAREVNGVRDSRHQLVHIECLSPQDIPRFKKLAVVACMQPRHCAPDITEQWAAAVGPGRSKYAWAFRSLRDSGATLAFASDWNVAEMDPLIGIYTALTRRGLDGRPKGGWIPDQAIDLDTALRAYTINGAYANFVDQNRGSVTPEKYGDLIMLSGNLFEMTPEQIKSAHVVATWVGGKQVYRAKP